MKGRLVQRGYVVHDPEWRAQDYEHKGAWAVTPPDGSTWADIAYYEAINLGHDHETAAEGLDVDEGRLGAAVAARDGCGVPGEQEQPTAAKPANSSPSVSALVETAPEDRGRFWWPPSMVSCCHGSMKRYRSPRIFLDDTRPPSTFSASSTAPS